MCNVSSAAGFYSNCGRWMMVLAFYMFANQQLCPYGAVGTWMFILVVLCVMEGLLMINLGWAHGHLDQLTLEQLGSGDVSWKTKRLGCLAKTMPDYSRLMFFLIGCAIIMLCVMAVSSSSKTALSCDGGVPLSPNPLREAIIISVAFGLIAMSGAKNKLAKETAPFLYVPEGVEKVEFGRFWKLVACATKCCHP
mmetsp:Transcript_48329/g.134992  ORF Transcript_48329/g.134992 Transcript_48329/m.134992 type:complete len:194 (-) Transcript_48329:110-691(-)